MKTIVSLCLALGLSANPLLSQAETLSAGITYPAWSEFCSGPYCEAVKTDVPIIQKQPAMGRIVLGTFVPVMLPFIYRQQSLANRSEKAWFQATEQNYWVARHEQFNTELGQCQQMQANDKLVECFMNIRQIENSKSEAHRQEALMRQQINAVRSLRPIYYY